jgi:beta-xylosidase
MTAASLSQFCPGEIWPDTAGVPINAHGGGILHHEGTYYWFGEHKIEGEAGNFAHVGVHVYSSRDLYNWQDEGIALRVSDDLASDITKGCILERPKVIFNRRTGKFVMWFHVERKQTGYGSALNAVAVADAVTGPYTFLRTFRPNAGFWPQNVPEELKSVTTPEQLAFIKSLGMKGGPVPGYPSELVFRRDFATGQMARDMTLFVDDDGSAYHIHASEENGTLHISQLSDDFLSTRGRYSRFFPGRFHEAPAIMKRRGTYYLITSGCTSWAPNAARLSRADSIWGPWTELGNPCVGRPEQLATTFDAQSTYILPVAGREDAFIFMADRWRPKNAIDGRYVWLPIQFRDGIPYLEWMDRWDLGFFK